MGRRAAGIIVGPATNLGRASLMPFALAGVAATTDSASVLSRQPARSLAEPLAGAPAGSERSVVLQPSDDGSDFVRWVTRRPTVMVPNSVLNELASDPVVARSQHAVMTFNMPGLLPDGILTSAPSAVDSVLNGAGSLPAPEISTGGPSNSGRESSTALAVVLLTAGVIGHAASGTISGNQRFGSRALHFPRTWASMPRRVSC
jgi:hypothetical protein